MSLDFDAIASRMVSNNNGSIRTAGRIEFVRDQGPIRRDIRIKDFKWDQDTLRNLTKILWAVERSHSYAISSLRLFSKTPSSEFSPDGLLGGRGYIQKIRDMRSSLSQAVETLSAFTDTIHDEINAPHWDIVEDPISEEIIDGAKEVKNNPEKFVEDQFEHDINGGDQSVNDDKISNPSPDDSNPFFNDDKNSESSDWWNKYENDNNESTKTSSSYVNKIADSSIDPGSLPGPRVMHIGPGASSEEFGYFTDQGDLPSDDPLGEGFTSIYPIIESPVADGISPYTNPTDGDSSLYKVSNRTGGIYSWLPGANNQKSMNYYEPGITDAEVEWMRSHNDPDLPPGNLRSHRKPVSDPLWEFRIGK